MFRSSYYLYFIIYILLFIFYYLLFYYFIILFFIIKIYIRNDFIINLTVRQINCRFMYILYEFRFQSINGHLDISISISLNIIKRLQIKYK